MQRVHIDLIGPLPETPRGHKWIITLVDSFTKWLIAKPAPNKESETVAAFFKSEVIANHGYVPLVVSDQGTEFRGSFEELLLQNYIKISVTSPYSPQSNGAVEVCNKFIGSAIKKLATETDWDLHLPTTTFSYNASVQASTGFSPYYMLYGRNPLLPDDLRVRQKLEQAEREAKAAADKAALPAPPPAAKTPAARSLARAAAFSHQQRTTPTYVDASAAPNPPTRQGPGSARPPVAPKARPAGLTGPDDNPWQSKHQRKQTGMHQFFKPPSPPLPMRANSFMDTDWLGTQSGSDLLQKMPGSSAAATSLTAAADAAAHQAAGAPTKAAGRAYAKHVAATTAATATAASTKLAAAQERQKQQYRKRRGEVQLIPAGSFVMVKKRRVSGKLEPELEGPYRLISYTADNTVARLRDVAGKEWGEKTTKLAELTMPEPKHRAPPPPPIELESSEEPDMLTQAPAPPAAAPQYRPRLPASLTKPPAAARPPAARPSSSAPAAPTDLPPAPLEPARKTRGKKRDYKQLANDGEDPSSEEEPARY
jgi:hypothetical protein